MIDVDPACFGLFLAEVEVGLARTPRHGWSCRSTIEQLRWRRRRLTGTAPTGRANVAERTAQAAMLIAPGSGGPVPEDHLAGLWLAGALPAELDKRTGQQRPASPAYVSPRSPMAGGPGQLSGKLLLVLAGLREGGCGRYFDSWRCPPPKARPIGLPGLAMLVLVQRRHAP